MSAGIKGNSGLVFSLTGTDPVLALSQHDDDVKNIRVTSEDKDDSDLTFAEAASGDLKDFSLVVTAIQSTEALSLWRVLWDNPGLVADFVYGPHGNAVPTAAKPHFTGELSANGRPEIGGEAAKKGNRFDFEYTFTVNGAIEMDDGT